MKFAIAMGLIVVGSWRVAPAQVVDAPKPPVVVEPAIRDVSADLAAIIEKHKLPAMAAVTVRHGVIVAQGVSGVRKMGSEEKATLGDLWHLGSCTKSMTATMCAMLVEKGTLRWDSTLEEVFPGVAPKMHDDFKKVTLAQLLTNRGGVPSDLQFDGLWGKLWHFQGTPWQARRTLLESVTARAPEYPPGTKNVYANASFAIAGHMAETAAKKSYEELMQELLFAPLGMTSCGWGSPGAASEKGKIDQPWGHGKAGKPIDPHPAKDGSGPDNPPAITPAGRLHCTIADWAKYVSIHELGGKLNATRECKLLKPETFDRLQNPPDAISDYAYGWGRSERPWAGPATPAGERYVLTHNGSNNQWFCVAWVAPKKDFAVVVCCNSAAEGAAKACDEACWAMISKEVEKK